jgi:polyhydroxybutyrate depolymerase
MRHFSFTILLSLVINVVYCQARQFHFAGEKRRYIIYLPASYHEQKSKTFPVVFNFHGGGMTMTEHMFYSRMNEAAEKHQFIVVYPQGIKQDWNVGFDMSYMYGQDDVGFIKALLTSITVEHRINQNKVYATGLSRGGFFCHRLAAEMPEAFAAIASVGAPLPDSVVYFHHKKELISVMVVHGSSDEIVRYSGKEGAYKSVQATYEYWKKHNNLTLAKELKSNIIDLPNDSTSVKIIQVGSKGVGVNLVSIKDGGHTWPGSHPFNIGFSLGRTCKDIDVNDIIWKFFSTHARSE